MPYWVKMNEYIVIFCTVIKLDVRQIFTRSTTNAEAICLRYLTFLYENYVDNINIYRINY